MIKTKPHACLRLGMKGMCSAFSSASETMCKALDAKGTTGRLNVPIGGKVFSGRIDAHTHAHPH